MSTVIPAWRHWLRTFKPFGLAIIVTRPVVDHRCALNAHAQEHIGYLRGGKGCRLCLKPIKDAEMDGNWLEGDWPTQSRN